MNILWDVLVTTTAQVSTKNLTEQGACSTLNIERSGICAQVLRQTQTLRESLAASDSRSTALAQQVAELKAALVQSEAEGAAGQQQVSCAAAADLLDVKHCRCLVTASCTACLCSAWSGRHHCQVLTLVVLGTTGGYKAGSMAALVNR